MLVRHTLCAGYSRCSWHARARTSPNVCCQGNAPLPQFQNFANKTTSSSKTPARWLAPDPSTPSPPFTCHANRATQSHARVCWLGMAVCAKARPGVAGGHRRSDLCGVRSGRSVNARVDTVRNATTGGGWVVGRLTCAQQAESHGRAENGDHDRIHSRPRILT